MFESYKKLIGKKDTQQKKEESIISKSLDFLLKPYKALFSGSEEKPKEICVESKKEVEKQSSSKAEMIIRPSLSKPRVGKILWKKK